MEEFKGNDILKENQKTRGPSYHTALARVMATKKLSHLMDTQLEGIEARTGEAEEQYLASKNKLLRAIELDTEYKARVFEREDERYTEMTGLGEIVSLQHLTKMYQDEAHKLSQEKNDMIKNVNETMTIIQETVSSYLYRGAMLEFNKHKKDMVKGLKEAIKDMKTKMTGNPATIISEMKKNLSESDKMFNNCTELIEVVNYIEEEEMKIQEASREMATQVPNLDKALIKALDKSFKTSAKRGTLKLPNTVRSLLEELKEDDMAFKDVTLCRPVR